MLIHFSQESAFGRDRVTWLLRCLGVGHLEQRPVHLVDGFISGVNFVLFGSLYITQVHGDYDTASGFKTAQSKMTFEH